MDQFQGYELIEQIGETLHSVVYRARGTSRPETVILKALKTTAPSTADIARLKHEYELIRRIAIDGIIRVHDIIDHDGALALVMEDFGGVALKESVQGGFTLERFLDLAVRLARILGELHRQGITHRDIKPGNILYNPKDDILKLTDFGIAAEITRKNEEVYNPEVIKGTLAYMSPEQTGRINCPVDYRSDLYSLGITFYEMLTGGVPFMAKDPMEIIYGHIAKTAVPPHRVNPNVPEMVSLVVMRLLAKALEERYQNGFGLMADLQACRDRLQRTGTIEPFAIGAHDISFKFSLPRLLVGREMELGLLRDAFEKVSAGAVRCTLVAGEPGVGKSVLIDEMNKPMAGQRGYYLTGKYDQLRRHVPYSAIIQALQSLVRQMLAEREERLQTWRAKLSEALGANGKIVTDAIPEIGLIIGEQPEIPELGPEESQNRFHLVFTNFARVFAGPSHPLILFLDDLQWADAASLNFIQTMITDKSLSHLLLIGAYRDNETAAHHPLLLCLDEIRKRGVPVDTLKLSALEADSLKRLIATFLRCDGPAAEPLARIVHAKTLGNPFFVNQFLKALYEEKYLTLDPLSGWHWDAEAIRQMQITDNVVELMTAKIGRLSPASIEAIKACACIGNRFDI
ncbi:MAG: AAA family ATPase [Desulfobacterales bacterium]|nr:AAA family ATPase [Desulfobacterales bacterium]